MLPRWSSLFTRLDQGRKKNGSLHNDFNALQKVHVSDFSKIIKILIFQHLGCPNRAITISLVINRVEIQNSETVFCRQAI